MNRNLVVGLILAGALLGGCSRQPSSPKPELGVTTDDLGVVELANHQTRHYQLSGGRDCQLTLTALAGDQVLVEAVVLEKDPSGNTKILMRPRLQANSGQQAAIQIGDVGFRLTPKLKAVGQQ